MFFFYSKNYIFYIALQYLMSYYIYYRFSPYIATELSIYQLHFTVTFVQFLTKHLHLNTYTFFLHLKKVLLHFTVEIPYICKNDHSLQLKPSLTNWHLDKVLAAWLCLASKTSILFHQQNCSNCIALPYCSVNTHIQSYQHTQTISNCFTWWVSE